LALLVRDMLKRAVPIIASPLSSVSLYQRRMALLVRDMLKRAVPIITFLLGILFLEVFPPVFVVEGAIQASVAIDIDMNQESALRPHL
jgi:hypothetical protein